VGHPSEEFVRGAFFAACQRMPTNHESASISAHASNFREAMLIIRQHPDASRLFNALYGLSCNWMGLDLCLGERPTPLQAELLAEAGVTSFVDITEEPQPYAEYLPDGVLYQKSPLKNNVRNEPGPVEAAARMVLSSLRSSRVYLHCNSGMSRSPLVAAIVVAARGRLHFCEGLRIVKQRRPIAQPHPDLLTPDEAEVITRRLADEAI
jgi:predicted protein tyrosine phosphatase